MQDCSIRKVFLIQWRDSEEKFSASWKMDSIYSMYVSVDETYQLQ